MKKIAMAILLMVLSVCSFAKVNGILDYVPAEVDGILCFDIQRLMKHEPFKKFIFDEKNKEAKTAADKIEKELGKYKLKLDDVAQYAAMFLYNTDNAGAIITTRVPESTLVKMINDGVFNDKSEDVKISKEVVNGKTIYTVKTSDKLETNSPLDKLTDKDSAFVYLDKNHVLVTDKQNITNTMDLLSKATLSNNAEYQSKMKEVNTNALAWAVFDIPKDASDPNQQSMTANMNSGGASIDLTNAKNNDLKLSAFVRCKDSNSAKMYTQQLNMFLMIFTMSSSKKSPELAQEINKSIKLNSKDTDIHLNVMLSEKLQDLLKNMSAKNLMQPAVPSGPGASQPTNTIPVPAQ